MTARVEDQVVYVANYASKTQRDAAGRVLPKTGTMRRQILDLVWIHGGLADFQIEELLNMKHQTASASRRSLVIDGFLIDSGKTRKNESGNECTIWVYPPLEMRLF